jgi:hypothetical protein
MSTSELQRNVSELLEIHLGQFAKRENHRPEWLLDETGRRLELDFYIPELKIAVEVQGAQHYVFVPRFHKNFDDFKDQQKRDELKRIACERLGITLFDISTLDEAHDMIAGIKLMLGVNKPYAQPQTALIRALASLLNMRSEKGKKASVKLETWIKRQNALLDYISANPSLLTDIDPSIAKWIMDQLYKIESAIQSFADEIKVKEQKAVSRALVADNSKAKRRFKAWKQERFELTGEFPTRAEYKQFNIQDREQKRKLKEEREKLRIETGYIVLLSLDSLYKLVFTTKTPEYRATRLNAHRSGHTIVWSKFHNGDLQKQYKNLMDLFSEKQVKDETHVEYWFDLTPEDVEYIKSLGEL